MKLVMTINLYPCFPVTRLEGVHDKKVSTEFDNFMWKNIRYPERYIIIYLDR